MPVVDNEAFEKDPAGLIRQFIEKQVESSPENRLFLIDDSPIFDAPLLGFADGDDPLFYHYKENIIGPFHMTPREVLAESPRGNPGNIDDISVICWSLPITKRTRASNLRRDTWPSLRWAHTRAYGEVFNDSLRRKLVALLAGLGCVAVAPVLSPQFTRFFRYPGGPVSRWSERHALYAAGLGTFGLSDGFITPKGKAMRCGSVVVNRRLPVTPRVYNLHTDNCPFFTDKSCGICIDRCPAGAITRKGHNRNACYHYMHDHIGHIVAKYNAEPSGCGLCQTGVPCESRIPAAAPGSRLQATP